MLTFREFYQICEGKKPDTPPHAVPGTYHRSDSGVQTYTLQKYEGPEGKPKKKEIEKLVLKRSGGKAVKQRLKKLAKSVKKIEEQNQGPSSPVKIDPKMGVVPNPGAGRIGQVRLKPGTPLIKLVDERQVINPPKSGGLEFPFRSVDGLIRGGAASGMKESFEDLDLLQNYLVTCGYVVSENEAISLIENMGGDLINIIQEDIEQKRKQLIQRQKEGISQFKEKISARVKANRKRLAKKREKEQLKSEIKREIARESVGDAIKPENVIPLDKTSQQNLRSAMRPSGPPSMKVKQSQKTQPLSGFVKRIIQNTSNSPL